MPIYEYECENCGYRFEQLQKLNDKPLVKCPECNQPKLHKLISAAGFQLKGSGWYVTDFKDKGKKDLKAKKQEESKPKQEDKKCPISGKKACDNCPA